MESTLLIATDLDRTLLPNGPQAETAGVRDEFSALLERQDIDAVYITGRHLSLVVDAIAQYQLPCPKYLITDVGTQIYQHTPQGSADAASYRPIEGWTDFLNTAWRGADGEYLAKIIGPLSALELQPDEQQGTFKLSYQCMGSHRMLVDIERIKSKLAQHKVFATVISSVDETCDQGLVDIVPAAASKKLALDWLVKKTKLDPNHVVFSGDSGNDLDLLLSDYRATLVGNATDAFRTEVVAKHSKQGLSNNTLFMANGYYSEGILQGVKYYFPNFFSRDALVSGDLNAD